ncbi:MAG: patatin-like phospholipase family protein [Candidatus Aenigmatarchaeota archaeon]
MEPKIGLALSGGGAKGFAHVGVLKSLEENGIKVDIISGVSAGALVGGWYSSGVSVEEIEDICYSTDFKSFIKLMFDPARGGGLVAGRRIKKFIYEKLEEKKIEKFRIKYCATAVDIKTGEIFYFTKGDATRAIMASIAIPGIFKPVFYKGKYLVDGGVIEPISLEIVKKMGGEVNIGVDLTKSKVLISEIKRSGKFGIKENVYISLRLMQRQLANLQFERNPDFLRIEPDVSKVGTFSFGSRKIAEETINNGKKLMDKNIPKLMGMIENFKYKHTTT